MKAIKCGILHTISDGDMKDAVVLTKDNKILEAGVNVSIPKSAEVIDASKYHVFPGFIDAHTHIGIMAEGAGDAGDDTNEMVDPVTPQLRIIDAINPFDPLFEEVLKVGIATVLITPGSANAIGGQCSVVKTWGKTIDEMLIVKDLSLIHI